MFQTLINNIALAACVVLLVFASYSDWKTRRVRNEVWLIMIAAGFAITVARWVYTAELVTTIFSVIVSLIISLPLYTIKIFGGADTKATIFVSLLIPKNISASFTPFFPLTLFLNIFAILGVLYLIILSYNLIGRLVRGSLFPGLESESKWRKMLALLTCIQSDLNSIHTKKHFYPVQQITEKDGKIEMHLIPPRRALDNTSTLKLLKSKVNHLPSNRIWVYFKKPLMPIILISVIISFFLGDLPMFLLNFF